MTVDPLTVAEQRALRWLALAELQDRKSPCSCPVREWLQQQRKEAS